MKEIKELHILVGLPGSGKTTFANNLENAEVLDFDKIYIDCFEGLIVNVTSERLEELLPKTLSKDIVVLDGLFVEQVEVEGILKLFLEWCSNKDISVEKIILEYWKPDKKKCLWNVKDRNSECINLSIHLLDLQKPNRKEIQDKFKVVTELKIHTIIKK